METLVTFFVDCPTATYSLDLFGSWDNFSQPSRMSKDTQMGHGRWRGCHRFANIICDGTPSTCCKSRNGALVAGGTYWYYYVRNGYQDFHDPAHCYTSSCPLLLGKEVNLLHVPQLAIDSHDLDVFTLDPRNRRLKPRPACGRKRTLSSHDDLPQKTNLRSRRSNGRLDWSLDRLHTAAAEILIMSIFGYNKSKAPDNPGVVIRPNTSPSLSRRRASPRTRELGPSEALATLKREEPHQLDVSLPTPQASGRAQTAPPQGCQNLATPISRPWTANDMMRQSQTADTRQAFPRLDKERTLQTPARESLDINDLSARANLASTRLCCSESHTAEIAGLGLSSSCPEPGAEPRTRELRVTDGRDSRAASPTDSAAWDSPALTSDQASSIVASSPATTYAEMSPVTWAHAGFGRESMEAGLEYEVDDGSAGLTSRKASWTIKDDMADLKYLAAAIV